MPARLSSRMSRHSLPWRIAATSSPTGIDRTSAVSDHSPLTAKYDALDHERTHQQEHDRDAERPVLVLERRRRVAPAADEARATRGR